MARYELTDSAWLPLGIDGGSILVKAGDTIEYTGWPGAYMEPLDDEGRELKAAVQEMRASSGGLTLAIGEWRREQAARRKAAKV